MLTEEQAQAPSAIIEQARQSPYIRILDIELGQSLPTLSAIDTSTQRRYHRAKCLIRLHDHPLGEVHLVFEQDELPASVYAGQIWRALRENILAHLSQDGFPPITELGPEGIVSLQQPTCQQLRNAFYATAPFASIIVSTHDRPEYIARCLPELLAQHYPNYEIIVVDNAPSTNATADLIQQTYGHIARLRYIREDTPGLSAGLNRGIVEARGEILAFTDDDVLVDQYWLLQLVRAFSLADNVACVTGLVLPHELETPAQIWFEEFGGFSKGFQRRIFDLGKHRPAEPLFPYTAGRFGTGANMAFRPDFLKSIKGFDTALYTGMDIAVFFQVIKQRYKLIYEPSALVHHTHRREYEALKKQLHSYGVALTAYLTKNVVDQPLSFFELLLKIPYGLFFTLSTRSPKNAKKSASYPKELTSLEHRGLLFGPITYLRNRRKRAPFPAPFSSSLRENGVS